MNKWTALQALKKTRIELLRKGDIGRLSSFDEWAKTKREEILKGEIRKVAK